MTWKRWDTDTDKGRGWRDKWKGLDTSWFRKEIKNQASQHRVGQVWDDLKQVGKVFY